MTVPDGVGSFTSTGSDDVFVAKFNPGLVALDCNAYGASNSGGANAVATDPTGNVWVTGTFIWTCLNDTETGEELLYGIVDYFDLTPFSNHQILCMVGVFRGTMTIPGQGAIVAPGATRSMFLFKLDPDLTPLLARSYGDGGSFPARGLAADETGVWITVSSGT